MDQIQTLQDYIPLALRTKSPGRMAPVFNADGSPALDEKGKQVKTLIAQGPLIDLEHFTLGIMSEAGEAFGALKKGFYGNPFDEVNYFEELGDHWWYMAIGLDAVCAMLAEEDRARWIAHLSQMFEQPNWVGLHDLMNYANGFDLRNQRTLLSIKRVLVAEMAAYNFDPEASEEVDFTEENDDGSEGEVVRENTHSPSALMSYVSTTLVNLTLLTVAFAAFRHRSQDEAVVLNELRAIWTRNIEKLKARYPDKFDSVRALERTDESLAAERAILEGQAQA